MPKKFDPEIKARMVRMVRQHLAEYGSVIKTSERVGKQLDISCNRLRRRVVQADVADGQRGGVPVTPASVVGGPVIVRGRPSDLQERVIAV